MDEHGANSQVNVSILLFIIMCITYAHRVAFVVRLRGIFHGSLESSAFL